MLVLEKLVKGKWLFVADKPSNEAWEEAKATGERVRLIDKSTKTVVMEWTKKE